MVVLVVQVDVEYNLVNAPAASISASLMKKVGRSSPPSLPPTPHQQQPTRACLPACPCLLAGLPTWLTWLGCGSVCLSVCQGPNMMIASGGDAAKPGVHKVSIPITVPAAVTKEVRGAGRQPHLACLGLTD